MTALFNTSTIFCGNFYNSFGIVRNNFIDNINYDNTMHGKVSSVVVSILEIFSFSCFIAAKSLIYGSLGPVGTYRIYLAFHNARKTGDINWYGAIFNIFSGNDIKYCKYIIKPFGEANWSLL